MPYGRICCTYLQLKYSSANRSKINNKSHTEEPIFWKMELWGKRGQENQPKAEKDNRESKRTRHKNREEISKSEVKLTALRFQTEVGGGGGGHINDGKTT